MERLSKGERMVLWSSTALLVCSFIPLWSKYEASAFGVSFSERGQLWNSYGFFPGKLAGLLVLAAVILMLVKMFATNVSLPPTLWVALGGTTVVLMVLAIVMGPEGSGEFDVAGAGIEISRGFMSFVGLALAAAMTWGGYQHMNEGASIPAPPPVPQAP